ncbi:MAG: DUF6940 family protein [Prochlorotrichaceae cyanobacterium]
MFDSKMDILESDRITRYVLTRDGSVLTYAQVLDLWQEDSAFRAYYTHLLAESPYAGYRWETPALSHSTATQPFQFVLLNTPRFASRKTDHMTYAAYFTTDNEDYEDHGIVLFPSLRGDATLIVPSPRTEVEAYGHLAAFMRYGPKAQQDAFWRRIAIAVQARLGSTPLWLNTAGGGVAWLHGRIDCRPKYYGYSPYKRVKHPPDL